MNELDKLKTSIIYIRGKMHDLNPAISGKFSYGERKKAYGKIYEALIDMERTLLHMEEINGKHRKQG